MWLGGLPLLGLVLSLVIPATKAQQVSIETGKFVISSIDGSARVSESFSQIKSPRVDDPLAVDSDEVLKLTFALRDGAGEKLPASKLPHQVVVSFEDAHDPANAFTSVASVKSSSGKVSWTQRVDRIRSSLHVGEGRLVKLSLIVASFGDVSPVNLPLASIELPPSLPQADVSRGLREKSEHQQGFHRYEERRHTFSIPPADQMPPMAFCLLIAAATFVVPWVVFAFLTSSIAPSLSFRAPTSSTASFLASIIALEVLALLYWNGSGLTLFRMLPWLLALGVVAILLGRNALTELRRVRLGKKV